MNNKIFLIIFGVFMPVLVTSCSPTYPRGKLIDGVKELCKKEYNVDVEAEVAGTTLGVRMPLEGLFDKETLQINPEAFGKVDGVMLSVSRVALSSDRSIDFYTVITYDKAVPGAEVVMTRQVKDLRRYFYMDISRGEFSRRMVFDVRFNPQGIIDGWLGGFTLKDIKLPEFMCAQASRRISDEFREGSNLVGKFKVVSCEGELKNRVFNFEIDISREGLPMSELIHGKAWHDEVLQLCMQKIAYVINIYDFSDFDKIIVHNKFDDKSLDIGRQDINSWRKRRVEID